MIDPAAIEALRVEFRFDKLTVESGSAPGYMTITADIGGRSVGLMEPPGGVRDLAWLRAFCQLARDWEDS